MAVFSLVLPSLGEGIMEAKIAGWLKQPGDPVAQDEPLFEVTTDKADIEIPSPVAGILRTIITSTGTQVQIHELVGILSTSSTEPIPDQIFSSSKSKHLNSQHHNQSHQTNHQSTELTTSAAHAETSPQLTTTSANHTQPSVATSHSLWHQPEMVLSPAVKTTAAQHNISTAQLTQIPATGAGGRLTHQDLCHYIATAQPEATHVAFTPTPLSQQRKLIATKMQKSAQQYLHLTTFRTMDFYQPMLLKSRLKQQLTPTSITALILYGVSRILKNHPLLMSWLNSHTAEVVHYSQVNLGVVIAHENHLIVPTIHQADQLSLLQLTTQLKSLTHKARTGKLTPAELTGGVFTITNPGMFGCQASTALIYGQQSAILSVGELTSSWQPVTSTPAQFGDTLPIQHMRLIPNLQLGLTFDHRLIDGPDAGLLLKDLQQFFTTITTTTAENQPS